MPHPVRHLFLRVGQEQGDPYGSPAPLPSQRNFLAAHAAGDETEVIAAQ